MAAGQTALAPIFKKIGTGITLENSWWWFSCMSKLEVHSRVSLGVRSVDSACVRPFLYDQILYVCTILVISVDGRIVSALSPVLNPPRLIPHWQFITVCVCVRGGGTILYTSKDLEKKKKWGN